MKETTLQKNDQPSGSAEPIQYLRPHYTVDAAADAYTIRVYMPGVARDQAVVTMDGKSLAIEGHRRHDIPASWRTRHREIPQADYRLRLDLNVPVAENGISATTADGVLTIRLPVAEEAKPRRITVE